MSCRPLRSLALLAAGFTVAACEGSLTTSTELGLGLDAAIAEAEVAATLSGDVERAEVLRHGAEALRWGIRPSTIEVRIEGATFRYLAFVVGKERTGPNGQQFLVRSLIAWTGRPPTAMLDVTSASDLALFGPPSGNGNENGPGAARGRWKNLVNHELWVATAGSADMTLESTGDPCPTQPADPSLACVLARWDLRINGVFQQQGLLGPSGPPIPIQTNADAVAGVVIR